MHEIIRNFTDAMASAGCAPNDISEIIPDGEDHYYRLVGDRKDKRGGYCLTIEADGFAWGNFRSFKTGDHGKWNSGKSDNQPKQDREAINARLKAAEADKRAKVDARHEQAAAEARAFIAGLPLAQEHDYLTRKGIEAHGAKIDGADLIYQGVSKGRTYTYQRIQPDGTKLFLAGARKQGCYFPLTTATEDKSVIIICEGVATAASIRQATGLPTLAAFDAGNLRPVAIEMRAKYKDSRIIIAADNDQYGGKNTGIEAAKQAAVRADGFIVYPEFDINHPEQPTDWNDLHRLFGLDAVKDKILAAIAAGEVPESVNAASVDDLQPLRHDYIPPPEDDGLIPFNAPIESGRVSPAFDSKKIINSLLWKKWPSDMSDGKLEPNSIHNIMVYLRHQPKYSGLFRYDRFAGRVILHREPIWQGKEPFKVCEIKDEHLVYMEQLMERDGLAAKMDKIQRAVYTVSKENWIDPPLEYFERLVWDRKPRLASWLERYLGAEGDAGYLSAVGMAFLIAGVARIYSPGCKAENMLVLEGSQGLLKSTALKVMANIGRDSDEESYFCDTLSFDQITEKDSVLKLQGKLIVEIPDLAGLGNREIEAVKAWMSVTEDEIRVPYGREMVKFPRRFILAGSTNESHWLKDTTGNRRFWPVRCGKIDIKSLKADREQLWAEAVHLHKHQAIWWIGRDHAVWKTVEEEQGQRLLEDIWHQPISQIVMGMNFITVKQVLDSLKIETKDQTAKQQRQVIDVLKKLGFLPKQRRNGGGNPINGWERKSKESAVEATFEEVSF